MELRLFVAVLISDDIRRKIAMVEDEFRKAASDVKWVAPGNLHITLKFLGWVEQERIDDIAGALSSAVSGFDPFEVRVAGAGAFPNVRRPQVVWIGISEGAESLRRLAERVETELESVGFPKENRKFKAHITIGRVKDVRDVRGLPDVMQEHEGDEFGSQQVGAIALMKSDLRREGPIYSVLREFELPEHEEGRDC